MEIDELGIFVSSTAKSTGNVYMLDGEELAPTDLGDRHCLLPLVVASMHSLYDDIRGSGSSLLALLEHADPTSHMLGWQIARLPAMPDGALLLFANYAVRHHLSEEPQPRLTLPNHSIRTKPSTRCELRAHLTSFGLANATPTPKRPEDYFGVGA